MISIRAAKTCIVPDMFYHRVFKRVCKTCALVAAALTLPVLAYAGTDNGKGNSGQNNGKQNGHLAVPEELSPVWMLLPISGVVMLLSWQRLSRAKT
jgi:hypothetical protein